MDVVKWAVGSDLLHGTSDTTLAPKGTATRAEVATVLMNFCENVVSAAGEEAAA